jgi:porin
MRDFLCMAILAIAPAAVRSADDQPCSDCADAAVISIDAGYTSEAWHQFTGGLGVGSRYLDDFELTADVDGALLGLDGWQFFGAMLYNNGRALSGDLTGATQGVTNIEAIRGARLFELWTQWQMGNEAGSLRIGLYDLNSEFDHIAAAELFINPSHGIGPDFSQSGENGPSIFPITSLAMRGQWASGPWTLRAAVLDAKPGAPNHPERSSISLSRAEGALLAGEVNYHTQSGPRYGGGYWRYTADFDGISAATDSGNPQRRNGNAGAYVFVESAMLLETDASRGLNLFARTGIAQSHINELGRYYGAGAVYSGLLSTRWPNKIGFAVAIAELGDPTRRALMDAGVLPARREYNYEFTCRFELNERIAVQADMQYIDNPGMDATLKPAMVFGLRMEVGQHWER